MSDYIGDVILHAKIQSDRPIAASGLMRELSLHVFCSVPFCDPNYALVPRVNHETDFHVVCFI